MNKFAYSLPVAILLTILFYFLGFPSKVSGDTIYLFLSLPIEKSSDINFLTIGSLIVNFLFGLIFASVLVKEVVEKI